jgi:hypothetical protein
MGDDEDSADPSSFVERALIETHHLANLTGTEEAKQARRRLVDAQSASRVTKTRDLLREAVEYLELARMDRRDAAKGFEKARMLAIRAETALGGEGRIQNRSIDRLFEPSKWSTDRETLLDLAEHEAVDSYEQLKYEMAMEGVFEELRGEVDDAELPFEDEPPRPDLSAEAALSLAAEELSDDDDPADDEGFVFVDAESLAPTGE